MLQSMKLSNFKGFNELDIPKLSRISLIGGPNNIGKTNVLESIFLFFDRNNVNMIFRQFNFRGLISTPFEPVYVWGPIFYDYNMEKEINFHFKINNKNETSKIRYNEKYNRPMVPIQPMILSENSQVIRTDQHSSFCSSLDISYNIEGKKVQESHLIVSQNGLELLIDFSNSKPPQASFNPSRMRTNPLEDSNRFGQLDIIGKSNIVVDYLKIIDSRIKSVSVITIGNEPVLHCDIGIGRKLPVAFLGDGISRFLTILLQIITSNNNFVLIDEIENGIHYSNMPKVWEAISVAANDFNCQVISTTHSYECLRAAHLGIPDSLVDDFNYIRLERNNENNTILANVFDSNMLGTAIENNWEVR